MDLAEQRVEITLPKHLTNGKLFRLRIRDPSNKVSLVEASTAETVRELKQRLREGFGIPVEDQRLLCKGTMMVEDRSLGSYGLDEGSVVVSAPRLQLRNGSGINGGLGWSHTRAQGLAQPYDAPRGMLMVPGSVDRWRPDMAGKPTPAESDLFFDSTRAPAPWQISSHEWTSKMMLGNEA
eukprot:TRINITY_DN58560_c0_g1_i1.p1 TRINITY_DN58560_c0_g1~~TRINITY_DN58560_c0_g1_i1.p1  ORF type:complete len:180 (+),score=36.99 TRINITY_DN58560_c0_g1_i1:110-649(+)